jgi:hypothetical protein
VQYAINDGRPNSKILGRDVVKNASDIQSDSSSFIYVDEIPVQVASRVDSNIEMIIARAQIEYAKNRGDLNRPPWPPINAICPR